MCVRSRGTRSREAKDKEEVEAAREKK